MVVINSVKEPNFVMRFYVPQTVKPPSNILFDPVNYKLILPPSSVMLVSTFSSTFKSFQLILLATPLESFLGIIIVKPKTNHFSK